MKTMYHGSAKNFDVSQPNPSVGRQDLCLTDEEEVAEEYGETVFELKVDWGLGGSLKIADEEEAAEIARDVYGVSELVGWLFESLDDPLVMEAIVEAGFHGVDFVDQSPESFGEHDTLRLFCYGVEDGVLVGE